MRQYFKDGIKAFVEVSARFSNIDFLLETDSVSDYFRYVQKTSGVS